MRRGHAGVVLALAVLLGAGCGGARPRPSGPGPLPPPSALGPDFAVRQRVVAHVGGDARAFDAVLEKRGEVVRVVGLTPFGTRAFVLEQRGDAIHYSPYGDFQVPFDPAFMLRDIHRLFDGLSRGAALGPRRFGDGAEVRYPEETRVHGLPTRACLENREPPYLLEVTTLPSL